MLKKDIMTAIDILKSFDGYLDMNEYSKLYLNTSENIKEYSKYLIGDYNSALLPTSSGDFIFESVLDDIKDITAYDINRLAKYFVKLKVVAAKYLTKDEFISFYYEELFDKKYFYYLKEYLDNDTRCFFEEIYKKYNGETIYYKMFRDIGYFKNDILIHGLEYNMYARDNFVTYINKYNELQDKLHNTNIRYLDTNILEFTENKNYDLINLTNIYEFINVNAIKSDAKVFGNLVDRLINNLNEDGRILISYLYQISEKEIKKYSKLDFYLYRMFILLKEIYTKKVQERYLFRSAECLNCLSIIPNIYEIEGSKLGFGKAENDLVLIYQKNYKK